ncbi:MAG: autotransporter-associated beta strand repeat-containing protein [Planctomycetia bacterium]|nr:autotransporter-associated beta strand repeat-containing protein [Planctomycetia bacterium]
MGGYLATKYGIGTAYAPYSLPDALPANTPVSISTGATLDMNGATATIGLTGQTGSSILLGGGTLNVNSTVDSTFAGNISGGGSFNKLGSATLTLSGVNTQTATTTISEGTLKLGSTTGLSQTTGATVVTAGGTLDLGGFNATTNGLVTFAGGPVQNGAITNNGDGYAGQAGTVSASLQGTGGLTKTTASTLSLTASNTFTGDTTLSAGTLTLGHALALQNSTLKPAGGTLGFGAGVTSPTLGGLAGSSNLAIATPVTLNVGNNNQDTTYSGVISGSASLNKIGSGVLTLSGTNTYAGSTTISSGTLRLQGSPVMPSGVNAWFSASSLNYANGQNITTWADLTGGHVATLNQGNMTFLTNQVNGQPAVQFSGNAYANMTGDMFSKQQYFVFSMPSPGGDWGTIIGSQTRSGYMFNPNGFMWDGNYPQAVMQNGGAPLNPNFQLSNIGNFMVVQVTGNSNDTSIRSGWALDRQEGWGGMNMNLAEVISFDHALSNSEQGAVGAYLSSKYGISTGYSGLLATSAVLPTSTVVTMASNTTFDVNNANQQIAQLRDAIPGTTTGHQVTLGQGTLTVGDAGNFSFSGTISGTGGITKVGNGVMDIKGTNDFTGTATAGGGVLLISSSLTGGANVAAAFNNTTATLGGTGTINGLVTVSSPTGLGRTNRITGAGVGTTGTLNLAGGLSFAAGAGGYFDINSTSDGDYLNVSGGSFTAAVGSVIAVPDSINRGTYNLIGFTGSAPSLSNFVLQDLNGNGASGGFALSYTGNVLQLIVNSDSLVWNGGSTGPGNNNWTTGENWTGGVAPQAGDRLAFAGSARTNPTNDFAVGTAFSGISFQASAASFTLSGNSITLQGNINNNSSNDQVINLDMALQSQAGIGTGAAGKNLTLNGTLSGAGGLNVTGSGTLILTAANTYAGDTKLTSGTLKLANQNAVQNSTMILNGGNLAFDSTVGGNFTFGGLTAYTPGPGFDITLQDSASNAVALTVGGNNTSTLYAGVLSGTGSLIKNGTGTLTLSAPSTHTGGTTINDGTVILTAANTSSGATTVSGGTLRLSHQYAVQNSVLTMNGGAVVFDSAVGGTFNFAGLAAATSGAGYDITLQDSANNPLTMVIDGRNTNFAGGLSGSGSLIKSGTGTQELSGILAYTGTTTINSGVLKVTGTGSNTTSNAVNVNGGELDLGKTSGLAFSFTSINIGRTDGSSATSATLKLLGSNQISSNTDLFIFNQGVLDLHGQNLTINTLNDSGASNTGRVDNTAGNGTLTVVGGEFYGVIQNSPGTTLNLTVASPTLVLYNTNNTYSGTTTINPGAALLLSNSSVNNNIAGSQVIDVQSAVTQFGTSIGRLIVNSPAPENNGFGSLKNSKLTLSSGQTIAGTGRIVGNLEIASGSTLSPGALTGSPGTLNQQQGSQTWDGSGHYKWELNQVDTSSVAQAAFKGISPGYDWMNVTGGLIVAATSGNKFNVDINGVSGGVAGAAANWDPHNSFSWTLATASTGITGSISTANFALNTAGFFSNNGQNNLGAAAFSIGKTGNDVVLSFQGGAATAYWGLAGATPSGTWSSSDASWSLLANGNGAAYKWTNGDDAVFSASANATGAYNVTINGGVSVHSITVEEGSPTIQSGTLTLIGATPTITVNASRSLAINTQVFGSNGLTKAGAGDLVLGGANTYSGGTTINQGKLKLGANNVIPNGPGAGNLAFSPGSGNSAILDLAGFNETVNGLSNGGLGTSLIDNTAAGSISTLTAGDGDADGPSLSFGGVIQNTGAGAVLNLTKVGIGTLGLSGANTYSGATSIKQGTVALSAGNNRLPTGTTVILGEGNNSGTLKLTSGGTARNQALAGLTTSGTGANNRVVGGASSNSVLTLNIADSDTFDGSLGGPNFFDNNLSLTKTGNGKLTLRGNNNYGGPTLVSAGELAVDGTNSGTGAVTVAAGATLSGHGKINSVIQGAGLISPGNSPGILSTDQINPLSGTDFGFELTQAGDPLWSNAAASLNDVLRITDAATPFTADLTSGHGNVVDIFFNAGSLTAGEVFRGGFYTDLDNDFINSVSSATFRFWVEGAGGTKTFNGNDYFSLSSAYQTLSVDVATSQVALANFAPAGPSGDITNGWVTQFSINLNDEPVAAPEPSTFVLSALGLAALGFVAWRRRRRA